MTYKHGLTLDCPAEADASGPITIRALLAADYATYVANSSDLSSAATIALIRRDAPDIFFLSSVDPHAVPDSRPPYPPEPPGHVPNPTAVYSENLAVSPLDWDMKHDGSADYAVIASFATWVVGPVPLRVKHPSQRLPFSGDVRSAPTPTALTALPQPPRARGVLAALVRRGGHPHVEGAFRAAIPAPPFAGEEPSPAFVTIFAPRLEPTGGASGGTFLVISKVEGRDYVGRFSLPLSLISPATGKHRIFVFACGESAPPFDVELP